MFDSFLEILDQHGGGVRAYEACANAARTRMREEPEIAAACFFIAAAAQQFIDAYGDQPLLVSVANKENETFKSYIVALSSAYGGGKDADCLATLNRIALQIAEST